MATIKCGHGAFRTIREVCFGGPVSRDDENRAAHGNICRTHECGGCGARRLVNVNGLHVEEGSWGPSRQARIEAAREAVRAAHVPEPLVCGELRAEVDDEGYVLLSGPYQDGDERTLPSSWLDAARRRRSAVAALQVEVQS